MMGRQIYRSKLIKRVKICISYCVLTCLETLMCNIHRAQHNRRKRACIEIKRALRSPVTWNFQFATQKSGLFRRSSLVDGLPRAAVFRSTSHLTSHPMQQALPTNLTQTLHAHTRTWEVRSQTQTTAPLTYLLGGYLLQFTGLTHIRH